MLGTFVVAVGVILLILGWLLHRVNQWESGTNVQHINLVYETVDGKTLTKSGWVQWVGYQDGMVGLHWYDREGRLDLPTERVETLDRGEWKHIGPDEEP